MSRVYTAIVVSMTLGFIASGRVASADDGKLAWGCSADSGSAGRHTARLGVAGAILAYRCDSRSGRSISADIWGHAGLPPALRTSERIALTFTFTRESEAARWRRIETLASPMAGGGVAVGEPDANAVLIQLLEGRYDHVTVESHGASRRFSLVGAEKIVRQANVACSTTLPPPTAARDDAWDRFSYADLFEVDMPDDAEEIASAVPIGDRVVRYGGLRGSDGHAIYTAIVTDAGSRITSAGDRGRFFSEFIAGTVEAARRNGATVVNPPINSGEVLAADLRVDHANGTTQFMRLAMRGSQLYVLTATCQPSPASTARKDRFLTSFRPL
ncbi:MAG TPA: hypothetical protein VJ890_26810 [Vineibacter sp.]|nr:hypothetical protein [Vineibacter sp.]